MVFHVKRDYGITQPVHLDLYFRFHFLGKRIFKRTEACQSKVCNNLLRNIFKIFISRK